MFLNFRFFICQSLDSVLKNRVQEMILLEDGKILDFSDISNILTKKIQISSNKRKKNQKKMQSGDSAPKLVIPTSKLEIRDPIYLTTCLSFKIKSFQRIYDFNIFNLSFVIGIGRGSKRRVDPEPETYEDHSEIHFQGQHLPREHFDCQIRQIRRQLRRAGHRRRAFGYFRRDR